jgi:CrcB protein
MNYLIVSIGAALGGALRYWLSNAVYKILPPTFPYGTLIVNIAGSFLLGLIIFGLDEKELISGGVKLFLTIGICGGFTTFSTFSYETFALIRDSQYWLAALNIILSVTLCLIGIVLSYFLVKILG